MSKSLYRSYLEQQKLIRQQEELERRMQRYVQRLFPNKALQSPHIDKGHWTPLGRLPDYKEK